MPQRLTCSALNMGVRRYIVIEQVVPWSCQSAVVPIPFPLPANPELNIYEGGRGLDGRLCITYV